MVALTIGSVRYSLSNTTATDCVLDATTANPAVSELKYGRPKKMVSFCKDKLSPIELIESVCKPESNREAPFTTKLPGTVMALSVNVPVVEVADS